MRLAATLDRSAHGLCGGWDVLEDSEHHVEKCLKGGGRLKGGCQNGQLVSHTCTWLSKDGLKDLCKSKIILSAVSALSSLSSASICGCARHDTLTPELRLLCNYLHR